MKVRDLFESADLPLFAQIILDLLEKGETVYQVWRSPSSNNYKYLLITSAKVHRVSEYGVSMIANERSRHDFDYDILTGSDETMTVSLARDREGKKVFFVHPINLKVPKTYEAS